MPNPSAAHDRRARSLSDLGLAKRRPGHTADGPSNSHATRPARPATIPNSRKGYKLTLWVSAATEAGVADVHGLVQLDGADPVPFCQLKQVHNPLAQALQEAYLAIDRIRAKPPRMAASTPVAPAVRQPQSGPASPNAPAAPPPIPTPHQRRETANLPNQKPVGQQSLF